MNTLTVLLAAKPEPKIVKSPPATPLLGETPTVGNVAAILNGDSTGRAAITTPRIRTEAPTLRIVSQGTSYKRPDKYLGTHRPLWASRDST
jgi:hypothetical protein